MKKRILFTSMTTLFLFTTTSFAYHSKVAASAESPIANPPQFIVIGSDDNTNAEAFRWMADVMSGERGLETDRGTNFDGSKRYMSFYVNTNVGWTGAAAVRSAAVHAYNLGHSIGNHTHAHSRFVGGTSWTVNDDILSNHPNNHTRRMALDLVYNAIDAARTRMIEAGIPQEHQFGFRTPFLAYSDTAFTAMRMAGILYDCSIEGVVGRPGSTLFPYTLDNIPGTLNEADANGNVCPNNRAAWWGRLKPDAQGGLGASNFVREHPGLWVLPASLVAVHPDDLAAVEAKRDSWMTGDLITGFDYNLWNQAKMTEDETVNTLMHTLQLHLDGNRAPFAFGPHSQFFFDRSAAATREYPNITADERQSAFERFVAYASEIPEVFFVTGDMVIAWMLNPVPASEFNPADYHRSGPRGAVAPVPTSINPENRTTNRAAASNLRIGAFRAGKLNLNVANAGEYTVSIHSIDGRVLARKQANLTAGANSLDFGENLARGIAIARVSGINTTSQRRISIR